MYTQTDRHTRLTYLAPIALVPLLVAITLPGVVPTPETMAEDVQVPRVALAMYQPRTGDLILGFDVPASLADGWRDSISIRALGDNPAILDGLGGGAHNIMGPDGSCIVMVQLDHADRMALAGAVVMTVIVEAGAVTGPGGATNHHTTMPIDITP